MAKQPENPITWPDVADQVAAIREAVDQLDPPPEPDDNIAIATHGLLTNLDRLEGAVGRRVERELSVEDTDE